MIRQKKNIRRMSKGFTLVEILIVLALIGIVAGLAMSNLGEIFGGGQEKAAKTWVNSTGEAYVTSYFAMVGEYPKTLNDELLKRSSPKVKRASDLNDPWGNPYVYQYRPGILEALTFRQLHQWSGNRNWDSGN